MKLQDILPVLVSIAVIVLVAVVEKQSKLIAAITATMPMTAPLALWIVYSSADGLGIGIGYTCALAVLGAIRELLGTGGLKGDVFGLFPYDFSNLLGASFEPFGFAVQAPGAFVALGLMLCAMNLIPSK